MNLNPTRDFMITNKNINTMFKPNNISGQFTTSTGINNDAGVRINRGKFNHQTSMVLDIIYDNLYRMFNQLEGTNYINGSLAQSTKNFDTRHTYYKTLLSDKKLKFYHEIINLLKFYKDGKSLPYDENIAARFLAVPDLIHETFPLDFEAQYNKEIMNPTNNNFDEFVKLIKFNNFEVAYFIDILKKIFYAKLPSFNDFNINIDLSQIFENGERTPYVLKKFFEESKNLSLSMTYPVTCFADNFEKPSPTVPKQLFPKTYMFAIENVEPLLNLKTDKSSMEISISMKNKFMVFFAHDAKLCVRTYIPSKLYSMTTNSFFIGKHIFNSSYYSKKEKKYVNKLYYNMKEFLKVLNIKDDNNTGNISHKKRSIVKSLNRLHDSKVININKLTSEGVKLSSVWTIQDNNNCIPGDSELSLEGFE